MTGAHFRGAPTAGGRGAATGHLKKVVQALAILISLVAGSGILTAPSRAVAGPAEFLQALQPLGTIHQRTDGLLAATFETDYVLVSQDLTSEARRAEIDRRHAQIRREADTLRGALDRFTLDQPGLSPSEIGLLQSMVDNMRVLFATIDEHKADQRELLEAIEHSEDRAALAWTEFSVSSMERRLRYIDGQLVFRSVVRDAQRDTLAWERLGIDMALLRADRALVAQTYDLLKAGGVTDPAADREHARAYKVAVDEALTGIGAFKDAIDQFERKLQTAALADVDRDALIQAQRNVSSMLRQAVALSRRYYDATWAADGSALVPDPAQTQQLDQELRALSERLARENVQAMDLAARLSVKIQRN